MIDTYLTYLRDVRRVSNNTVESYARDLTALGAFAEERGSSVGGLSSRDLGAFVRSRMTAGLAPRSVARSVACVRGSTVSSRSRGNSIEVRPRICGRRACRRFRNS
jgi:site-specific recombinase XerD